MMAKQEKVLWGLFAGILVILYLLSSTDLIIKEKKTEIYPVSVIIGDTSDDYYINFRKGLDQAAIDYNVDVSFITLFEKYDAKEQMELVRREIDDGAEAVILAPVEPVECGKILDQMNLASPLVIAGTMFPSDSVKSGITVDHYEKGRRLGAAIAAENAPQLPVYIFTEDMNYGYNQDTYDGLVSVLKEAGFQTVLYEKGTEDTFRRAIEATVYPGSGTAVVAALDAPSTDEAAEIIGGSPAYGRYIAGLYGIGTTPKLLNQMDKGVVRGMMVSNQYDEGYLCIEKAVEAIRKNGSREQFMLDSYYIEKTDLRKREFEKILYPID